MNALTPDGMTRAARQQHDDENDRCRLNVVHLAAFACYFGSALIVPMSLAHFLRGACS